MKSILIPVNDRPECALALHHGFELGAQLESDVIGCHIRPHRKLDVKLPEETNESLLVVDSYDIAWETTLKENSETEDHFKAQQLYKNMAEQFNYKIRKRIQKMPIAMWKEIAGSPERLFAIQGPVTDLIIVSRPSKKGRSIAKTFMLNAVLKSSSPVIVLPQKNVKTLGKRICIAWNQSTEASLAVKAAMPMILKADEVTIVTCGDEDRPAPKAKHLQNYLKHWNVDSNHIRIKGKKDHKAILKGYDKSQSDLLIMGGYSRSRLRQQVFGGVTEYMLNEAQIPLLILHT